jgi:hypothetical protein
MDEDLMRYSRELDEDLDREWDENYNGLDQ